MLKMNKKGASLGFDKIENKNVVSSIFWDWEIKKKKTCLPHMFFFKKSSQRNTCLFLFSLIKIENNT